MNEGLLRRADDEVMTKRVAAVVAIVIKKEEEAQSGSGRKSSLIRDQVPFQEELYYSGTKNLLLQGDPSPHELFFCISCIPTPAQLMSEIS